MLCGLKAKTCCVVKAMRLPSAVQTIFIASIDLTNTLVAAGAALGLPPEVNQGICTAGRRVRPRMIGAMEECAAARGGFRASWDSFTSDARGVHRPCVMGLRTEEE